MSTAGAAAGCFAADAVQAAHAALLRAGRASTRLKPMDIPHPRMPAATLAASMPFYNGLQSYCP